MDRDRQLKRDRENRQLHIHEEYEKNRQQLSEDKVKEKAAAAEYVRENRLVKEEAESESKG